MNEEVSFQHYLKAKRTVDDRALNRAVWKKLEERLVEMEGATSIQALDVGAGVGVMFQRMVEWGLLARAEYTILDEQDENIRSAREGLASWARRQRLDYRDNGTWLEFHGSGSEFLVELAAAEMSAYLRGSAGRQWDLIVAHAFLDLLDGNAALTALKEALRPGGLMYLTINFDGLTAFEPIIDPALDEQIINLYHQTMDERVTTGGQSTGGSRTGRRMFRWLGDCGLRIVEAGSSDWIVYARDGRYPADEAYFLRHILQFFSQSLRGRPELEQGALEMWLAERGRQIQRGELVFMAHQYDFLAERA